MKISRIGFDTCECDIKYSWDETVPQDERVHTVHEIINQCKYHQEIQVGDSHDNAAWLKENQLKNGILSQIAQTHPELVNESNTAFKEGVLAWKFNENRELEVFLPTLTSNQKSNLDANTDIKVKIM